MASLYLHLILYSSLCWLHTGSALSTQGAINRYDETGNTTTSFLINRNLDGALNGSKTTSVLEPETEPEGEPDGEPTTEPEPTDTPELPPFAEPVPDWEEALPLYGVFWIIHIYILGSLFAILAVYSLVSLIRLRSRRLLSHGYFVALNLMMLLIGLDRAVYFFVDAYNYKGIFPLSVAYMLLGLGFPCLSSAFSILFLALLHSTQTRLVPPKIQRAKVLAAIIIFHFTVSIVVDVTVGLFTKAQVLLLLCQGVFLIWGLFLSISYLVIFRRLHRSSVRQFRESTRLSISRRTSSLYGISPFMRKPRNNWGSAIKVTLFASFFSLTLGLLQLYGIVVVYGPLGEKVPEPWSWVWYQLAFRICELVMCILMSFVATQPFRYTTGGTETPMLMCCTNLCEKVVGKTSRDLQDADAYRLVSGDGEGFLTLQGNDYKKGSDRRVIFDQTDSEPYNVANLQLPPSNTFYRESTEEPLKKVTLSTQAPESGTTEKNGTVADNNMKNNLALETDSVDTMPSNACASASAPITTQRGYPWSMIQNNLSSDDIKPCHQNKNNHHSCPSTPLPGRCVSVQHLSNSNPSLSEDGGLCLQTDNPNSAPLTTKEKETANDTERRSSGVDGVTTENTREQTEPDNVTVEEAERREVVQTQIDPGNATTDLNERDLANIIRKASGASESTDL